MVYSVEYGRNDFGQVEKHEFSHAGIGGYIIFTGKPMKIYNFISNKFIKAYIFIK